MSDGANGRTAFARIYECALTEINSETLRMYKRVNPALFYRKMFLYLQNGIPYFDTPMGIGERLRYTMPQWYDDESGGIYVKLEEKQKIINTGVTGFDMACAVNEDGAVNVLYDKSNGDVTLTDEYPAGTCINIDFYTDGFFETELSIKEIHILGVCTALAWFKHFANDEVDMTPKMHDSSFKTISEAADTNARTARLNQLYDMLQLEMGAYARELAYCQTFGGR